MYGNKVRARDTCSLVSATVFQPAYRVLPGTCTVGWNGRVTVFRKIYIPYVPGTVCLWQRGMVAEVGMLPDDRQLLEFTTAQTKHIPLRALRAFLIASKS